MASRNGMDSVVSSTGIFPRPIMWPGNLGVGFHHVEFSTTVPEVEEVFSSNSIPMASTSALEIAGKHRFRSDL